MRSILIFASENNCVTEFSSKPIEVNHDLIASSFPPTEEKFCLNNSIALARDFSKPLLLETILIASEANGTIWAEASAFLRSKSSSSLFNFSTSFVVLLNSACIAGKSLFN
jgi:hypothetical protein